MLLLLLFALRAWKNKLMQLLNLKQIQIMIIVIITTIIINLLIVFAIIIMNN